VLQVSTSTVIKELKKGITTQQVNLSLLKQLNPETVEVDVCLVKSPEEAEGPESERSGDVGICWQEAGCGTR